MFIGTHSYGLVPAVEKPKLGQLIYAAQQHGLSTAIGFWFYYWKLGLPHLFKYPRIQTDWFCIFWIPLIPLDSYVIHEPPKYGPAVMTFFPPGWERPRYAKITALTNLYWPQVLRTHAVVAAIIFLIVFI